jgi:hypothetical protein
MLNTLKFISKKVKRCSFFERRTLFNLAVAGVSSLVFMTTAYAATGQSGQRASEAAHHAVISTIALQLMAFDYAAQEWATAHGSAWNVPDSSNLAGGAPILLYVGQSNLCGAPAGTGQTINMVSPATYLPPDFQVPLNGALCAMVYPNTATSGQSGQSAYGSNVVGDTLVMGYFVPGIVATEPGGPLYDMPPGYLQNAVLAKIKSFESNNAKPVENRNGWAISP